MSTPRPTLDDLTAHVDGLRRLARALVRNEANADDLVQDTLVAAAQSTSGPRGGVGPWLRGIARNLARKQARDDVRRSRREQRGAVPEVRPAAADVAAGVEIQRRVIALLDALPARERTAVYLRYFEDMPPRRIATRMGCPVATVHTCIRRGRERLRAGLDRSSGGSRARWTLALLPMARAGGGWPWVGGGVAMKKVTLGIAALVVLLVGVLFLWDGWFADPEPGATHASLREAEAPSAPRLDGSAAAPGASAEARADTEVTASSVRHVLTVRLDAGGREPLPGRARVLVEPIRDMRPGERWDGSDFDVEDTASLWPHEADISALFAAHPQPMIELEVAVDHPAYLPMQQRVKLGRATHGRSGNELRYEVTLRARSAAVLEGRVLQPDGSAAPGVQVGVWPADLASYGRPLELTRTDVDGRYRLRVEGGWTYAIVAAAADRTPGRARARVARDGRTAVEDITLGEGVALAGVVLLNDEPVPGAAVTFGRRPNAEDWRKTYDGWWSPEGKLEVETWSGRMAFAHLASLSVRETADGMARAKGGTVTDAEGQFRIDGLGAGDHRLRIEPWLRAGFVHRGLLETLEGDVSAPDEELRLRLVASSVRFRVYDGEDAVPDAAVRIGVGERVHGFTAEQLDALSRELEPGERGSLGEYEATVRTREDGLTMPVLVPPNHELRIAVSRDGFVAHRAVVISKPARGASIHAIALKSEQDTGDEPKRGTLVVALKTADGSAVPRAALGVFRARRSHPTWRRRAAGTDNTFRFENLHPGTWRVVLRPGGTWAGAEAFWMDAEATVDVRPGEVTRVALTTRRGGRLRLAARDVFGRPTHARVRIVDDQGVPRAFQLVTRRSGGHGIGSGSLSVPGPSEVAEVLPPGRYRIDFSRRRLAPGEAATLTREIHVRPGAVIDLDVQMPSDE